MKKYIYNISWIVLGLLLSFIAHVIIEIVYIKYALSKEIVLTNHMAFGHGYCVMPVWLQILLPILGITLGVLAGRFFWRVIYIEELNLKKKKKSIK